MRDSRHHTVHCRTLTRTSSRLALIALLGAGAAMPLRAQTVALTRSSRRIGTSAIAADFTMLQAWDTRAHAALRDSAPALRFQRQKAITWMAFVLDEYLDNERGPVVDIGFARAQQLIVATEAGTVLETGEVALPGTRPVRRDLHARLAYHLAQGQLNCAPESLAVMSVRLVTAAHAPGLVGRHNAQRDGQQAARIDAALSAAPCRPTVLAAAPAPTVVADTVHPVVATEAPASRIVTIPGEVHFAFARSALSATALARLRTLTTALRDVNVTRLEVFGHADRHGPKPVNMRLSLRRALAVRRALIAAGVPAARVSVIAFGSARLADPEHTRAADARNRRAEIRVVASDGTEFRFTED